MKNCNNCKDIICENSYMDILETLMKIGLIKIPWYFVFDGVEFRKRIIEYNEKKDYEGLKRFLDIDSEEE